LCLDGCLLSLEDLIYGAFGLVSFAIRLNAARSDVRPIPLGLSNTHRAPSSAPDHLQVGHCKVYFGGVSESLPVCSTVVSARTAVQLGTGQRKQFLAHLSRSNYTFKFSYMIRKSENNATYLVFSVRTLPLDTSNRQLGQK
jgi:hypothetical protein